MSLISNPTSILITGATGGIGQALALAYAAPSKTLILQGRDEARLSSLAKACEMAGATVVIKLLDVRERLKMREWLTTLCNDSPPDLVILNAGVNTNIGDNGEQEPWDEVEALVEINVLAVMAAVDSILPAMRKRGYGQIALVSSLAGWFGLPLTPSYSASKAAIKAYGEALRGWLYAEGISVNLIMPGYVESAMCEAMPGPKPFFWTAERAASVIRKGLAANIFRISFPFPLNLGTWLLVVMPPVLSIKILHWLGYGKRGSKSPCK